MIALRILKMLSLRRLFETTASVFVEADPWAQIWTPPNSSIPTWWIHPEHIEVITTTTWLLRELHQSRQKEMSLYPNTWLSLHKHFWNFSPSRCNLSQGYNSPANNRSIFISSGFGNSIKSRQEASHLNYRFCCCYYTSQVCKGA